MDDDNVTLEEAYVGEQSSLSLESDTRQRKSLRSFPSQLSDKARSVVRKSLSGIQKLLPYFPDD